MTEHESSRTLVKSTPELWAECSDAAALARHLGSVGEIRITRLEPETTVAWEGTAARGTVQLEPAGWGTRVTLTMTEIEMAEDPVEAPAEPAAVAEPEPQAESVPDPTPVPEPVTPEAPPRRGWFARLLSRLRSTPAVEPGAEDGAEAGAETAADLDAMADTPEPQPREPAEAPAEAPSPTDQPAPLGGESALRAALDSLGRAHHRPYSRA